MKHSGDSNALKGYIQLHKSAKIIKFVDDGFLLEDGTVVTLPENDEFEPDEHTITLTEDEITINLALAKKLYGRQMIVVVSTYIELVLKDFLAAVFSTFPERMHNYLDEGDGNKGLVSLKLITKAPTLLDLLYELSEQASSNALKGRFKTQLNNLNRVITGYEIPKELQTDLVEIIERRNRIVHEASQEEIGEDYIRAAFDTCMNLVKSLADFALTSDMSLDVPENDGYPF